MSSLLYKLPERVRTKLLEIERLTNLDRKTVIITAIELLYDVVGDETAYRCVISRIPGDEPYVEYLKHIRTSVALATKEIRSLEELFQEVLREVANDEEP